MYSPEPAVIVEKDPHIAQIEEVKANLKLDELSSLEDETLWTTTALHNRQEWSDIRAIAKDCLISINKQKAKGDGGIIN